MTEATQHAHAPKEKKKCKRMPLTALFVIKKRLETMQENSIWETGWKENTYILKYYAAVKKNEEDFYILLWENL